MQQNTMKILVENSGYRLQNMGDLAMLQVGVARLKSIFPDSSISVFTLDQNRFGKLFPDTNFLLPHGRDHLSYPLINSLYHSENSRIRELWTRFEDKLRCSYPQFKQSLVTLKLKRFPEKLSEAERYLDVVNESDLIVAMGGGYITDSFMVFTSQKLDTLALSARLGKTTVMLGQGIGPLSEENSFEKANAVLPLMDLIALREKRASLTLLHKMDIAAEKIMVTGDDAIELAFNARQANLGSAIGVNIRIAGYSNVNKGVIDLIRKIIQNFAASKNAQLLPIPIEHAHSSQKNSSDSSSIREILKGYDDSSDGGASLDTPLKVIEQAGLCRLVVTGSYHAGVFALSQGIPVIGLAKSQYYVDKFEGLADQFLGGCVPILMHEESFTTELESSLSNLWDEAEQRRPQLLKAAQQQVESGYIAYRRVQKLVDSQMKK
jgi:polysaccharide pyruvyl transferase WcaK-like protein